MPTVSDNDAELLREILAELREVRETSAQQAEQLDQIKDIIFRIAQQQRKGQGWGL